MPCEEDVTSSHIDTEKPNVSINPSLTQSVAGGTRDLDKQQLNASAREPDYNDRA